MPSTCAECGGEVPHSRAVSTFCSTPCRKDFNNRRAVRGAALYDLFMAQRYQRGLAADAGCFALMCALGQQYREEDVKRRGQGWRSWLDPATVLRHRPWLRAMAMVPKVSPRRKVP